MMISQLSSLPIKYRPQSFDQVMGNEHTIQKIQAMLNRRSVTPIPHSYMFTGPPGCGKTTLARIMIKELNVEGQDFKEINAAAAVTRGVRSMQDLVINLSAYYSARGMDANKAFLLDEAHKLTSDAQNSLLKILEEPPAHCYYFLCTTEPQRIIPTIRSRCTQYSVTRLSRLQILNRVQDVAKQEKIKLSDQVARKISLVANGSARSALVLLDQVIDLPPDDALASLDGIIIGEARIDHFCKILIDPKSSWQILSNQLTHFEGDPEEFRLGIIGYLAAILLRSGDPFVSQILEIFLGQSYQYNGKAGLIQAVYLTSLIEKK